MRLICPNCSAQYEVDGDVIPQAGRDVQCSNCGHTWFQRSAQTEEEEIPAPAGQAPAEPEPRPAPAPPPPQPAPEETTARETSTPENVVDDQPDAPVVTAPIAKELDPDVASVLREEADLETSQRQTGDNGLQTQPDLGLSHPPAEPKSIFEERAAQLQDPASGSDQQDSNRRDLLPDIEEINSTLTATSVAIADEDNEVTQQKRRSGFRRGFLAAVVIFATMALAYVFSPDIADALPQSATALASYVDWVNSLRSSVDGAMQGVIEKLTGLLDQVSGNQTG